MVNVESFTCNILIVIDIQILQVLIDKSMLDFLQCDKNRFSPLKPMEKINNVATFIFNFTYGKHQ